MQQADSTLPRRKAATGSFRRGQPRSVTVFGDHAAWHLRYLASSGPEDPALALHQLDHRGNASTLASATDLLADIEQLPAAERARRERLREGGAGITAYSSDAAGDRSAFTLSGRLWIVGHDAAPQALPTQGAAIDPRLSPTGATVAYHAAGDLVALDVASGASTVLCRAGSPHEQWGLAEFIAAEEMGRYRGFWWSPAGDRLLVAQVDESAVARWWISDPADPAAAPRPVSYPAAGTPNAAVRLWLVDLAGGRTEVHWDRASYPYLAAVQWTDAGALISAQPRDQTQLLHLLVDRADGSTTELGRQRRNPWVDLVPGSPALAPDGDLVTVAVDPAHDAWRVRKGEQWLTPPQWYVRSLLRCDASGIWVSATTHAHDNQVLHIQGGTVTAITRDRGWHSPLAVGTVPVVAVTDPRFWQPTFTVGDPSAPLAFLPNRAEAPRGEPRLALLPARGAVRVGVILPEHDQPAPVIVSSYGGPHAQRVVNAPLSFATEQWLADQGFVVVMIDGRGSPGVAPSCEAAIAGDLAGPVLADQVAGLQLADQAYPGRLDLARVGIRGWSFGGYLAALAVLREPDVFHAAFAGAPVTEWRLYDTHYTERYLGGPAADPAAYDRSSLLPLAPGLRRPLCLVHGMADDNVVAAHTLQLSAALTAHGRPHEVLPLPGVSHMTPQESITENLLHVELAFFARHLLGEDGFARTTTGVQGLPSN